jgi:hypothetical protein
MPVENESLVGQALSLRRPLRPPRLFFNNLRWAFDRAAAFSRLRPRWAPADHSEAEQRSVT